MYIILVPNQTVKLRVNANSIEHFKKLGYEVSVNEIIKVRAEDLSDGSSVKIKVICDYCNKEIEKVFQKYKKQRKHIQKDACYDCFEKKQAEITMIKYGVESIMDLDSHQEKMKNSLKEKYGVENIMHLKETVEKFKSTMMKNHGVEFAQQSPTIRQKSINTLYKNYGVEKTIDSPVIRKKMFKFEYVNSKKVSTPQRKIAEYLNGDLNVYIEEKFVDILIKENVVIEYNGSGHYLSVLNNRISMNEFITKEKETVKRLNASGYKCLIIENPKDKYLNKKILHRIKNEINKLNNSNIMTIEMLID